MSLDAKHPLFTEYHDQWVQMEDTYEGEKKVKERDTTYLPATSGHVADGKGTNADSKGAKAYAAYKQRAVFPDIVRETVHAAVGIMHHKPPNIELPKSMAPLLDRATVMGEGLEMLLRRINAQQLITGRLGLLPDLPTQPQSGLVLPRFALYDAVTVINWDDGEVDRPTQQTLNLVVLNESEYVRTRELDWEMKDKYRVLLLGDVDANEAQGLYRQALIEGKDTLLSGGNFVEPAIQGNKLDFIPFTFVNSKDVAADPDSPPLIGLSNLALAIYRGEADYRQSLFMQGQDTLVIAGGPTDDEDAPVRTGAGAAIRLPMGGTAEYIGVDSSGLSEQREALRNDRSDAARQGVRLLSDAGTQREAAETVKMRVAASTATLNEMAITGAFALETQLRYVAIWLGENPDKVKVEPNLDFTGGKMTGKDLLEYMQSKNQGAPLSLHTVHQLMRDKDVTTLSFEDELAKIQDEEALALGAADTSHLPPSVTPSDQLQQQQQGGSPDVGAQSDVATTA